MDRVPLTEGLNERAGSAEAPPGREPRHERAAVPHDASSRGAEGSGKHKIPEASVCRVKEKAGLYHSAHFSASW